MKNIALIVAAGESSRFGGVLPKQYMQINKKTILRMSIESFIDCGQIDGILVVINKNHIKLYEDAAKGLKLIDYVIGGSSRRESVFLGLQALEGIQPENVLIHDASRPFVSSMLIKRVIYELENNQAVDIGVNICDTVKQYDKNNQLRSLNRDNLYATQTPQGFKYQMILALHKHNNLDYTDDVSLCLSSGINISKLEGEVTNKKITFLSDFQHYSKYMERKQTYRVGIGVDIHKFSQQLNKKTKIKVCGIELEHNQNIIAHSDGDVGLHSITEAILGSMALGNIGKIFPSNNKKYKNIDSRYFLEYVNKKLKEKGGSIVNIDLTIICEKPKIMPHSELMQNSVASMLGISPKQVSVKATTSEKIGFLGSQKGIAAQAVCCITINEGLE